jgi:superfamily II DNA or RNA helicase
MKNIFWLATGGGKSVCFASIIRDAVSSGGYVVFAVRRRELIKQASSHMKKWNIGHSVYMANHKGYRAKERVQICSIDTLSARDSYPYADKLNVLVVIDEAHDVTPTARKYSKFMEAYNGKPIIGFTATPFGNNSLWEGIVRAIEPHELMEQGYLVPCRTFAPNLIDTSNVKISRGEFNEQELFEASSNKEIIGDFVRDWKKYAQGRPTILFAVNVEHSKLICDAFVASGIRAVHADGNTKSHKRDHIINEFIQGKIQVLTNVNIFSTGLDIPSVSAIQICRPTQSVIWHLQALGRGLRPSPDTGKQDCIIIDNAGNTLRHGTPYKVREAELGKQKRKTTRDIDEEEVGIKRCEECLAVYDSNLKECPECGHVNVKKKRQINHSDGDLVELELTDVEKDALVKKSFASDYYKLKFVADTKLKRKNKEIWLWEKMLEKYGLEICKRHGNIVGLKY